jgi:hypothetical protein
MAASGFIGMIKDITSIIGVALHTWAHRDTHTHSKIYITNFTIILSV